MESGIDTIISDLSSLDFNTLIEYRVDCIVTDYYVYQTGDEIKVIDTDPIGIQIKITYVDPEFKDIRDFDDRILEIFRRKAFSVEYTDKIGDFVCGKLPDEILVKIRKSIQTTAKSGTADSFVHHLAFWGSVFKKVSSIIQKHFELELGTREQEWFKVPEHPRKKMWFIGIGDDGNENFCHKEIDAWIA